MSLSTAGKSRIELSTMTAILAVGDVLAILLFVALGEYRHGYNPLVDVGQIGGTLAPFLIGWVLVAVVGGLYARGATRTVGQAVVRTAVAWILAVVIAQLLRSTALFHGSAALTFAIVSVLFGGTVLVLWRVVATLLSR